MKPLKLMTAALVAMLFSIASVMPASSADVYNPPSYPDEVIVSSNGVDWTGFYAGLFGGYGWGNQDHDLEIDGTNISDVSNFLSHDPEGFLFGGTIGINYQPRDSRVVVGLEGDWAYANHDDGNSEPFGNDNTVFSETEINSIGTARVRAGYLVNPSLMPYITGGLAWASVKTSVGAFDDQGQFQWDASLTEEDTNVGWTVGAGVEYKLDDVWSVKADYLYVDLADTEHTASTSFGGGHSATLTDDLTEHMVRVGINAKLF